MQARALTVSCTCVLSGCRGSSPQKTATDGSCKAELCHQNWRRRRKALPILPTGLAANQLVLRDFGRTPSQEVAGKPIGSVHGDSIGVHACDSANAWRNMSRVTNPRNSFASIILGAYQLALDRAQRGGDFLNWQPLPHARYLYEIKT